MLKKRGHPEFYLTVPAHVFIAENLTLYSSFLSPAGPPLFGFPLSLDPPLLAVCCSHIRRVESWIGLVSWRRFWCCCVALRQTALMSCFLTMTRWCRATRRRIVSGYMSGVSSVLSLFTPRLSSGSIFLLGPLRAYSVVLCFFPCFVSWS